MTVDELVAYLRRGVRDGNWSGDTPVMAVGPDSGGYDCAGSDNVHVLPLLNVKNIPVIVIVGSDTMTVPELTEWWN